MKFFLCTGQKNGWYFFNDLVQFPAKNQGTNFFVNFFSPQLQETLEKLDIQLSLELWYTEHGNGLATAGILSSNSSSSTPTSNGGNIQTSNSQQQSSAGGGGGSGSHLECVSCRVLNINLNPQKGIHYHLPILFDYFHLSAVSLTIHAALVSLHQPYIK